MFKRMTLLRRRADQTPAAFQVHWSQVHAAFVLRLPGIRRYVQNDIERARPAVEYNGIVELWFDDEAALRRAFASDAGRALPPDEANFLDGKIVCDVEERVIGRAGSPPGAAKLVSVVHSRLAGDEGAWTRWHERLSRALPPGSGVVRVSNHRIATQKASGCAAGAPADVFAFVVYHFASQDARSAFVAGPVAGALERIDGDASARSVRIDVTERLLLDPPRPADRAG